MRRFVTGCLKHRSLETTLQTGLKTGKIPEKFGRVSENLELIEIYLCVEISADLFF